MLTDLAGTTRPPTTPIDSDVDSDVDPGPAPGAVVLRTGDGDDPWDADAVRRIFRATLLVGRPSPDGLDGRALVAYERLCLDWYLRHGAIVLAERDGVAIGYLLACLDEAAHHRWLRGAALRWVGIVAGSALAGRLRGEARRFVRARLRDGWHTWRRAPAAVVPAHAHLNLLPGARAGRVGRDLARVMDDLVAAAGLPGWYGEMNVPPGRSLAAIERAGSAVVHRQPSHTFTELLGVPVERVTLARLVPSQQVHLPAARPVHLPAARPVHLQAAQPVHLQAAQGPRPVAR